MIIACAPVAEWTEALARMISTPHLHPYLQACPFLVDIDECADENTHCDDGKYCSNNPGSFACVDCNKACSLCSDPGTEKCSACNAGFQLTDKGCEGMK